MNEKAKNKIDKTFDCKPFYDCNIPPEIDGYILEELSDDIYINIRK